MNALAPYKYLIGGVVVIAGALGALSVLGWQFVTEETPVEAEQQTGATWWYEREILVIDPPDTEDEEARIVDEPTEDTEDEEDTELETVELTRPTFRYVEVVDSCPHDFSGDCVNMRAGPGTDFPVVSRLRNGQVFKVGGEVEREGRTWYKLVFHDNEWLRYPERVTSEWYVIADYVHELSDEGPRTDVPAPSATGTAKRIVVDRSEQTLAAYEDDTLFMKEPISTGLELSPTPRGTFTILRKTPSRYMQGPIPGLQLSRSWDLPGVPWVMYFNESGAAIHGTFWHNDFGSEASAGCVNLPPDQAKRLYQWADLGTTVVVQD